MKTSGKDYYDSIMKVLMEGDTQSFKALILTENPTRFLNYCSSIDGLRILYDIVGMDQIEMLKPIIEQKPELLSQVLPAEIAGICKSMRGQTMLGLAVAGGQIEMVRLIIEAQPELLMVKGKGGSTPLHLAIYHDSPEEIVRLIVETRPELLMVKNNCDSTPLHLAISNSPMEIVRLMVEARPESLMVERNEQGSTPLWQAAACQNKSILELALKKGINPETVKAQSQKSFDLIHPPLKKADIQFVKWLVKHEMIPNTESHHLEPSIKLVIHEYLIEKELQGYINSEPITELITEYAAMEDEQKIPQEQQLLGVQLLNESGF